MLVEQAHANNVMAPTPVIQVGKEMLQKIWKAFKGAPFIRATFYFLSKGADALKSIATGRGMGMEFAPVSITMSALVRAAARINADVRRIYKAVQRSRNMSLNLQYS